MRLYLENLIEERISDLEREMKCGDYIRDEEFEEMAELLYFREEIFKLNRFKEEASRNISSIVTELKIEEGYEEEANAY